MAEKKDNKNEGGEIIIFQTPDGQTKLDVQMQEETVWLTQQQMSILFQKDRTVITRHINNVFKEGELDEKSNVHFLHFPFSDKPVKFYNLDVIISVGYRVKSQRGTQFRIWANRVLKEYLLRGYSINHRLNELEDRVDRRLARTELEVEQLNEKMDFYIHSSLPKQQGVFYDGQVFDAYEFMSGLIERATQRIILIDNYVDEHVLMLIGKRVANVSATIYTKIDAQLKADIKKYNAQYQAIDVQDFRLSHDRFLCIDNDVYLIGASIKDLGKKWFGFSRMYDMTPDELTNKINKSLQGLQQA